MDKATFTVRLEQLTDTLFRVAWAILYNEEDCRDAMQEAALKAWQHRAKLRSEAYFGTWVTRILINECHTIRRKRKRLVPLDMLPESSSPPPDPALGMALRALPEHLRLPLTLHYAEGFDYARIAETLRLPQATVRGRIARAKQQLRKELSE